MIIAVSIVTGFQNEIKSKVLGFTSHVQITSLNLNLGVENDPISGNQDFYPHIDTLPEIKNIQIFAHKPGIIKTKKEVEGVVVKGISTDFDWSFFKKYMISGDTLSMAEDKPDKKNRH
jgi:lipoprotein-releasing system permease protein